MSAKPPKPEFAFPQLTPMQQIALDTIKDIDLRIGLLEDDRASWAKDCTHVWVPRTDKKGDPYTWCTWKREWEISSHAFCLVCGENSDRWYCTEAPTHVCDYDDKEDPAWDTCLHCGNPDERK